MKRNNSTEEKKTRNLIIDESLPSMFDKGCIFDVLKS